jgi:hypothetical protein
MYLERYEIKQPWTDYIIDVAEKKRKKIIISASLCVLREMYFINRNQSHLFGLGKYSLFRYLLHLLVSGHITHNVRDFIYLPNEQHSQLLLQPHFLHFINR